MKGKLGLWRALCFFVFLRCAAAAPIDVAILKAQLLNYLANLPKQSSNRVLSGQMIGDSIPPANMYSARSGYAKYIDALQASTGKTVALAGVGYASANPPLPTVADMLDANVILKKHWNLGGIVQVAFGPHNPWTGGLYSDTSTLGHSLTGATTPGTAANLSLLKQLDDAAAGLADLQNAGVVVLWRPMAEFNANWFWWGAAPGQDYINLWRYTHDYLTVTKGLRNLLWVFAATRESGPWAQPIEQYYPGDAYVDIVGIDLYSDTIDQPAINGYQTLSVHGKPFVLAEFGPDTNTTANTGTYDYTRLIAQIRSLLPNVSYFMCWSDYIGSAGNKYWPLPSGDCPP